MKKQTQRFIKIVTRVTLFGMFTLLCFANAYGAGTPNPNLPDSYGDAAHNTPIWQELETNEGSNAHSEYGVFWSVNGGDWGHDDLYVGNTVQFQFNMHKENIGTHYADHLKAWVDWENDGTFDVDDKIIYEERILAENENVTSGTSYTPPNDPDFSYVSTAFTIDDSDELYLRARVTCSESLLTEYFNTNGWNTQYIQSYWQHHWNDASYRNEDWWQSYEEMFAATGTYGQGEVEEWYIKVLPNNPVPEPATMILFGCGLLFLAKFGRKRTQM